MPSQFYASIQGGKGEATRQGTKKSGIEGHIRGRGFGVDVQMYVNAEGEDEARITLTHGSYGYGLPRLIGVFTKADLEGE